MSRSRSFSFLGILAFLSLASLAGCRGGGGSGADDLNTEQKHIFHAVDLANQYAVATKKQPTSIDEVKDWAVKEGKGSAEDFSSTRDNQPYGIAAIAGMGSVVLYEQNGKGGKCYLYRMGQVNEIKKDEVANAIKTAQSMGRPGGMNRGQPAPK